ncbi:EAL domain-containing protein [Nitratireductor aquimarinus]|uniref:sensor domain-containing protein n=1 Tax=Nitratireductor aquimarinus TaxID=889300 RepID=UPI0029357DB2|nr:EAL domain-containing protein [Nitratireductor aquimarinus]MDV2968683.1 EAL domain-containing protein [Nitratireductor aquimarinus]
MRSSLLHARSEAFLDCLPQLACMHTAGAQDCTFNSAWSRYLGLDGEFLGVNTWLEYIHPEDRSAVRNALYVASRYKESYDFQCRVAHRSGQYRRIQTSASMQVPREGEGGFWIAISVDLENQGFTGREEFKNQRRLRALQESRGVVLWVADPRGLILEKRGWSALTAQHEKEALGWGWLDRVHPDDRYATKEAWLQSVQRNQSFFAEYRLRLRDEKFKWVEDRGVPILDPSGTTLEWVGIISDVNERKEREFELIRSGARLQLAIESTQLGIWDVDYVSGEREWSDLAKQILEVSPHDEITADTFINLVHPNDRERVSDLFFKNSPVDGSVYADEFRVLTPRSKREIWVSATGKTLADSLGQPIRKLGTIRDTTKHNKARLALEASEKQLRMALDAARMNAWEVNRVTGFVKRSPNALKLLGLTSGSVDSFLERTHPEDQERVREFIETCSGADEINIRYNHPDGQLLWLCMRGEQSSAQSVRGVTFDISEQVNAANKLIQIANKDFVTELLNRNAFNKILKDVCECSAGRNCVFHVIIIDIDGFKEVNDAMGHDAGDALLRCVAQRLKFTFGQDASIARIGGDEFALIVEDSPSRAYLAEKLRALHLSLSQSITISGRTFNARSSVGVASFPGDGSEAAELMRSADLALCRAKTVGGNRSVYYTHSMRDKIAQRRELFTEFERAISQRQLQVHYQPKISLSDNRLVGFEALLRWRHPSRGLLAPGVFKDVFESFEISQVIGEFVLDQITNDLHHWYSIGRNPGRIAFNLSSADFFAEDLSGNILRQLKGKCLPPSSVEVEITEDVFLKNSSEKNVEQLKVLYDNGVGVALDDFGTGFASLTHLKTLPLSHIKIDRSFIDKLDSNDYDRAIVSSVISLSRDLKMETTAEGVEDRVQLQILRELGCNNIQGYLISPALHPEQLEEADFFSKYEATAGPPL